MSLSIVYTRANLGVAAPLVTIEVHLSNGLPAFNLVGLPETTVKESRDRVRSAIINSDFEFPAKRITIKFVKGEIIIYQFEIFCYNIFKRYKLVIDLFTNCI
jgi:magnesium chelatase family protein